MDNIDTKYKLMRSLETMLRTLMIGSISVIEDRYKDDPDFQEIRTKILDLGNKNIRLMRKEIETHEISKLTYNYHFKPRS